MAKRKRPSYQSRERDAKKRERAHKKEERAAARKERRDNPQPDSDAPQILDFDEVESSKEQGSGPAEE